MGTSGIGICLSFVLVGVYAKPAPVLKTGVSVRRPRVRIRHLLFFKAEVTASHNPLLAIAGKFQDRPQNLVTASTRLDTCTPFTTLVEP